MRTTIGLNITNLNDTSYPVIIMRKFFNMVFVKPNGKELSIYTGTVFCGSDDESAIPKPSDGENIDVGSQAAVETNANPGAKKKKLIPQPSHTSDSGCTLAFSYAVCNDTGESNRDAYNLVKKISFEDLTDSYMKQTKWVAKVWGDVETLSTQEKIKEALQKLYPNHYQANGGQNIPDVLEVGNALSITDDTKGAAHSCIACKGAYGVKATEKDQYTLTNDFDVGIEAINWVKTTIKLKKSILDEDNKLRFVVHLGNADKDKYYTPDVTWYYTPDFTWYFAPPPNYVVDEDAATLRIGKKKEERKKVVAVPDATTVYFDEWLKKETIKERTKSRVAFSSIINNGKDKEKDNDKENDNDVGPFALGNKKIIITVSFKNPGKHGNWQFFIGLIVAFLLSFCADKTRLADFLAICHECMEIGEQSPDSPCNLFVNSLGILLPFLVTFSFFSYKVKTKRCFPEIRWFEWPICIFRWVGLATAALLIAYIFFGWLVIPGCISKVVTTCAVNQRCILSLLLPSLICNLVYIAYCRFIKKKKIVDFF